MQSFVVFWVGEIPSDFDFSTQKEKLSDEDLSRIDSIESEQRKQEIVFSRNCMTALVAQVLKKAPGEIQIEYPKNASPRLFSENSNYNLSLSHDHGKIAVAIGQYCKVGIDILSKDRKSNWRAIVKKYFHPDEQKKFQSGEEAEKRLFEIYWTLKESLVKIEGMPLLSALGMDFSGFSESVSPQKILQTYYAQSYSTDSFRTGVLILPDQSEEIPEITFVTSTQ